MLTEADIPDASHCDVTAIPQVDSIIRKGRSVEVWDASNCRWVPSVEILDVNTGTPAVLVRDAQVKVCVLFGLHEHLLQVGTATSKSGRKRANQEGEMHRDVTRGRVSLTNEVWAVVWTEVCDA